MGDHCIFLHNSRPGWFLFRVDQYETNPHTQDAPASWDQQAPLGSACVVFRKPFLNHLGGARLWPGVFPSLGFPNTEPGAQGSRAELVLLLGLAQRGKLCLGWVDPLWVVASHLPDVPA